MEMENEREKSVEQIEHFFHEHPLVFVEEQSNEGEKAYCSGCGEVLSGPCFSCLQCNYHLHKKCAETPYEIYNHPLHPEHSFFVLQERLDPDDDVYGCALCKEKRNMFLYECDFCSFSFDIKCANLSFSCKFNQESKHDIHQHPLSFIESLPVDELKRSNCSWCHEPLIDATYFCIHCPFNLHKKCLDELPTKINHPSHHIHPLILNCSNSDLFCKLCQNKHSGVFYSCSLCHFNIDIECAWPRSIVEDKSRHQHPFTLFWRQDSFICDACGNEGNYTCYICSTCIAMVHKDCTQLPRIIKTMRHNHCIFHKYFLETQELTRQDCKICFNEVKLERGTYSCVKPGCNYIVHVNCALENKDFYDIVEQENQCEELYENSDKSMRSSIDRVIEVNDGEATKIKHFSHEHCLVLADKIEEEIDRKCDGCMLSISTLFYYCSDCHFFLHKTCAELPRIKRHWLNVRETATLEPSHLGYCNLCNRRCSGFFYYTVGHFGFCIRCAMVPDIIECQGHQHLLSFDFRWKEKCNACGGDLYRRGAFKCEKCNFALDFACLTLPHSARHKFDEHVLNLTYHDENDDKEQRYCDVCEKERDPSLWYYYCSICDNSAHPKCVLGNLPFVKDGIEWYSFHYHQYDHRVNFFRKVEGYPKCSNCDKLCLEEIVKCATCNDIIHFQCPYSQI